MNLGEFRQAYPEYDDLSDSEVVNSLHRTHYADLSRDQVATALGIEQTEQPLGVPGQDVPRETVSSDAQNIEPAPESADDAVAAIAAEQPRKSMAEIVLEKLAPVAKGMGTALAGPYQQPPSTQVGKPEELRGPGVARGAVVERTPLQVEALGGSAQQAAGELRNILAPFMGFGSPLPSPGYDPAAVGRESAATDPLAVKGREQYQRATQRMQALRAEATDGDPAKTLAYDALSVITDMIPALGAGFMTGNPAVTLAIMGPQAATGSYAGRREEGEQPLAALGGATYTGAVEVLTEKIPIGFMFAKGLPYLEKVLKVTVGEGAQEAASSLLQSAYDKGTISTDMTLGDALAAAGYEGTIGLIAGGAIGSVVGIESGKDRAARRLAEDVQGTYLEGEDAAAVAALNPRNAPPVEPVVREQPAEEIDIDQLPRQGEQYQTQTMTVAELEDVPGNELRKSPEELAEFTEKIQSGELAPPIIVETVDGKPVNIQEGNHTLAVRKALGDETVEVRVIEREAEDAKQVEETAQPDENVRVEQGPEGGEVEVSPETGGAEVRAGGQEVDARLKRPVYRDSLQQMADELTKGGGITYVTDEQDRITGRTPSVNPEWFQAMNQDADTTMSVKKVQNAVEKALAGKKLGIRQYRVVQTMLDTVTGERTAPENMNYVRAELERAREIRRQADIANPEGWAYAEDEYTDDMDGTGRALLELYEEARRLGDPVADRAEEIMEGQGEDAEIAAQLAQLIQEARNGRAGETSTIQGQEQPQAKAAAETEEDLAGKVDRNAQQLADEQRRRDEQRSGVEDVPVESGEFFGREGRLEEDLFDNDSLIDKAVDQKINSWAPGTNYVGMISGDSTPIPGTRPKVSGKPITRESVLRPYLKALGITLYQGNVKGPRLGYYLPKMGPVRIKNMSDLEVTAHEIAHLIDDRVFGGFGAAYDGVTREPRPWALKGKKGAERKQVQVYRKELAGVSYDADKLYEGFAEFVRLWMTQPNAAMQAAPQFTRWFNEFVERHEYGKALKKAREGMTAWFEQDAIDRMNSKIGFDQVVNDVNDTIWDESRQTIFDNLHGVLKMERTISGNAYPEVLGAYETTRLTRAAYSIVDGAIRYGAPVVQQDGSFKFEGKGLQQIMDDVAGNLSEFKLYAVARSASELKQQGRENLFTKDEIAAGLALETDSFRQAFDAYQEWNGKIIDFAEAKGFVGREQRKRWQRKQYIPFYRVNTAKPAKRAGKMEGGVKATQMLTGGTGNLADIMDNMVQNASHMIVESLKNEARREIVKTALGDKSTRGGQFVSPISKDTKALKIEREALLDRFTRATLGMSYKKYEGMLDAGQIPEAVWRIVEAYEAGLDDYTIFWQHGQAPRADQVIAIRNGDKTSYYQIGDPLLWRSVVALNNQPKHIMRRGLNAVRRVMQGTVTLTFDFMAANIWRDTLHGWIFSKHGFKPVLSSLKGMKSRIAHDQAYKDFIANGGGMASYMVDEGALQKHVEKFYNKKGIDYKYVVDLPAKWLYWLEVLADSFEVSTRIGEFKESTQRGVNPRHAAFLSREISTDFSMRGDSELLGWLYDSVIFLKAGVNGMDRVYRGLTKDDNRAQIWAKAGMVATISAILAAINYDEDKYLELEDWDRDGHWHVFLGEGDNQVHLRFPKIWEIGAMASVAERSMTTMLDTMAGKEADVNDLGKKVAKIIRDQFKLDYVPGAIEPLIEVYGLNRSRFTGRPVETYGMLQREPFARYSPYTSRTLIDIAQETADLPPELQISPSKAQALIRGYFNTWGLYGLMLADAAHDLTEEGQRVARPKMKTTDYPVLRRFMGKQPGRTKYGTEFWELYKKVADLQNTINFMVKQNRPDIAERKMASPGYERFQTLQQGFNQVNGLQDKIELIYTDENMTAEQKRIAIDDLKVDINQLYKHYVEAVK